MQIRTILYQYIKTLIKHVFLLNFTYELLMSFRNNFKTQDLLLLGICSILRLIWIWKGVHGASKVLQHAQYSIFKNTSFPVRKDGRLAFECHRVCKIWKTIEQIRIITGRNRSFSPLGIHWKSEEIYSHLGIKLKNFILFWFDSYLLSFG